MYPTTEEELQDYFQVAMAACEGHPHEQELMELLVSQMADLSDGIENHPPCPQENLHKKDCFDEA